jgi:hypothetical protein
MVSLRDEIRPPRPGGIAGRGSGVPLGVAYRGRVREAEAARAGADVVEAVLAVDEVVDPVGQAGEDLRLLRLGQSSVLHGLGEIGLRTRDQRGLQPVDRLALLLCDLGEGGAVAEARLQLRLGDTEVGRRRVEVGEVVPDAVDAAAGADTDERHLACGDPRLHLVALRFRDPTGRDGGVDAVLERLLQRGVQLRGVDAELLGRIGHDCVALLGRCQPVGGDSRPAADECCRDGRDACDLALRPLHLTAPLGVGLTLPVEQRGLRAS